MTLSNIGPRESSLRIVQTLTMLVPSLNSRDLLGFQPEVPAMVMANPPSALLLVYPLGFLGATAAELLWLLLLLISLVISVRIVWKLHGSPKNLVHLLGYSFVPVLSCILSGPGDDLHTSWLGLVSEISSIQSIFRWSFFVALYVEAAPLRAFWRGADPVGHPYPKL